MYGILTPKQILLIIYIYKYYTTTMNFTGLTFQQSYIDVTKNKMKQNTVTIILRYKYWNNNQNRTFIYLTCI